MVVHRVLRKQSQADLLCQFFPAFLQFMPLGVCELAHFRVGRGIIDQRREFGDLFFGVAIGFDCLDDRTEFGEFA